MSTTTYDQQLQICCGVRLVYGFDKRPDPPDWGKIRDGSGNLYTKEYIYSYERNYPTETKEGYLERIRIFLENHVKTYHDQKSYTLVALNKEQNDQLSDIIKGVGFEILIPMMRNPSGTEIILYVKYHIKKPKEIVSKKSVLAK